MNKEKCYHMTEALKEITEDEKLELFRQRKDIEKIWT